MLGAMMVSEGAIAPVILDVRLHDEDFYRERHRIVFRAITGLYEQQRAGRRAHRLRVPDPARRARRGRGQGGGLRARLDRAGAGQRPPLRADRQAELAAAPAARHLAADPEVRPRARGRARRSSSSAPRACCSRSPTRSAPATSAASPRCWRTRSTASRRCPRATETLTGTPSGFRDLDAMLGGFQPGNLIVIAARPSLGKSALVCNIAENVASKHGKPVAFFSLEMSEAELAHRFIACRSRIPNDKLRKGNVAARDWPRVVRACNELEKAPLWLDDSSDLSLLELRAKARRLAASEGGLGPRDRRLPAADARRGPAGQPGRAGRPVQPRAEDPRPRAEGPVIGISQLSRAPEQRPGQAADALRPAGVAAASSRTRTSSSSSTGPRSTTRTPIRARPT